MKVGGHITESGQEDELNSEKCGTGGHSGKTFSIGGEPKYWEKDLELVVETVEAGGNDVKNPFNRGEDYICSSDISGGYRALLITNLVHSRL